MKCNSYVVKADTKQDGEKKAKKNSPEGPMNKKVCMAECWRLVIFTEIDFGVFGNTTAGHWYVVSIFENRIKQTKHVRRISFQ